LISTGVAGYLGWILFGTGIETHRAQTALSQDFRRLIDTKDPNQAPTTAPLPGSAYAELVIARIGLDMIVVEGTQTEDLKKGPGHYADTADPWDRTGRVGIAGHRTTYLAPFWNLQEMKMGDPITLRTEFGTFRYAVTRVYTVPTAGSGVVLSQTAKPTLVLTTCDPRFSATQRLIVTADRVDGS
jgi:sortase A